MRVTVTNPTDQSRPAEMLLRPESERDRETLERLVEHYQCESRGVFVVVKLEGE